MEKSTCPQIVVGGPASQEEMPQVKFPLWEAIFTIYYGRSTDALAVMSDVSILTFIALQNTTTA